MLIDLRLTSDLSFAGQTSTQTPHPVQSSGATWIVRWWSFNSRDRNDLVRNPSGAEANASASYAFIRIAACGQTMAHLPQSMQMSGSHTGISAASLRFSNRVVPVGNDPSTGIADTGSRSPCPAIIAIVTRSTNPDPAATDACSTSSAPASAGSAGTGTSVSSLNARSIAALLRSTISEPRRPYALSTEALISAIASSTGITSASAK